METFSVASVATRCESLAARIIGTRTEVDEILKKWDEKTPHHSHFAILSEEIHTFSAVVDSLTNAIQKAKVISPAVQVVLVGSLDEAEKTWAVMDKQIRRLQSFDTTVWIVDPEVIEDYETLLQTEMALCELFREVLERNNTPDQEAFFQDADSQKVLRNFSDDCRTVMGRRDILVSNLDPNTITTTDINPIHIPDPNSSSSVNTSDPANTPTSATDTGLSPSSIAGPSVKHTKTKSGSSGFFDGLSQSFQAMTANFRYKPEPLVSALCQSASRGDLQQVKGFLEQGAKVDGRNEDKKTPLICAILALQVATAKWLVDYGGASVRTKDGGKGSRPPLFHAAVVGSTELVSHLLARGADPNERTNYGQPYFVDAVHGGNALTVRLLLDHGSDAGTRDMTGRPVLVHAVQAGNIEVAKTLIQHGADVNARDISGQPVLMLALSAGPDKAEMVRLLVDHGADVNCRDITGQPMLVQAVNNGRADMVRLFLLKGADPNVKDIYGRSLLQTLVKLRSTDMIRLFLEHGVSPNQLVDTTAGETLLLHAIGAGEDYLTDLLVKHGADPNAKDRKGRTPLMQAMQHLGKDHIVKLLIEHGANPNMEGLCSPLVFATASGRSDLVQLLKTYGAVPLPEPPPGSPFPMGGLTLDTTPGPSSGPCSAAPAPRLSPQPSQSAASLSPMLAPPHSPHQRRGSNSSSNSRNEEFPPDYDSIQVQR